ncbi:MAG: hypothetical protein CR963_01205 [Gammaproteobacteria bacterium]|nr:MAG: hypothetical protein CR963_01205 [Gammaproteobacteria bacterium]
MPPDVDLLNIAYDNRQQPPLIVQKSGQMTQAIALSGSQGVSFLGFIIDGIEHILIGTDHVLFVLCLTMAAGLSWRILWSVTGFTLGHSVTFALGAFGIFPQAAWFIPLVEWIIAASIIVAALLIFVQSRRTAINGWHLFLLTALIGLIHGYGFAFVFSELVGDIGRQVMALIGFNIGVEVGQLMVVAAAMLVLWLLSQWHRYLALGLRFTTAVIAISIAAYWVYERGQSVLAAL